jgi:5-methylcytosine-specific restriction endonuclease McrA
MPVGIYPRKKYQRTCSECTGKYLGYNRDVRCPACQVIKNKVIKQECRKRWRASHPEKYKAQKAKDDKRYRDRNQERLKEQSRAHYKEHRDEYFERQKRWNALNPDRLKLIKHKWDVNNPDAVHRNRVHRRARSKAAEGEHTYQQWLDVKKIFDNTCPMCFRSEPQITLTVDHKIPLSKGGTNFIDNIQPLCKPCNSSKHTKIWFASCPYVPDSCFV